MLAGLGGLAIGAGLVAVWRERAERRAAGRRELSVRRALLPVLERRASVLGIGGADRGSNAGSALTLALTLARAINRVEEAQELPFGDTMEAGGAAATVRPPETALAETALPGTAPPDGAL